MKIIKIFNNNAVATITDDKADVILTGSGIGFQKKIGDEIDESKIEKHYFYQGGEQNPIYQLFSRTPVEYFKLSQMIMEEAQNRLGVILKSQVIVALTDHILFAVERAQTNTDLPNLVLPEIRTLYKKEYEIGLWAIDLIKKTLNIELKEDEAGYIALHILNGTTEYSGGNTMETLQLINGCISIISEVYEVEFDENSLDYLRLNTHLKFLAQRVFDNEQQEPEQNDEMFMFFKKRDAKISECVGRIKEFIKESFDYELLEKEQLYLMIHIHKITH